MAYHILSSTLSKSVCAERNALSCDLLRRDIIALSPLKGLSRSAGTHESSNRCHYGGLNRSYFGSQFGSHFLTSNIKMIENQVLEPWILEVLERRAGIEPASLAWKARVIASIRTPRSLRSFGINEPG